jgi:HK97 family phage major capsid protein
MVREYDLSGYNTSAALLMSERAPGSVLEAAVHAELVGRSNLQLPLAGVPDQALRFPLGVLEPRETRDGLLAGQATKGAELLFTSSRGFARALRARSVLARLGATLVTDLSSDARIVVIRDGSTASWHTEADLVANGLPDNDVTLEGITLEMRIAGATLMFSRQLLVAGARDAAIDELVRRDLLDTCATALDRAGLVGTGAGQPLGLLLHPDVTAVTAAGGVTLATLAEVEGAAVETQSGARGWAVSPNVRKKLRTTPTAAGSGRMLMSGGDLLGHRVEATSALAETSQPTPTPTPALDGMAFGAWDELLVGTYGAADLIVDPFTHHRKALIEVTIFLYADVQVLQPSAFAISQDVPVA